MSVHSKATKVTTHTLQEMKRANEPITMLTAYDTPLHDSSMQQVLMSFSWAIQPPMSWPVKLRPFP